MTPSCPAYPCPPDHRACAYTYCPAEAQPGETRGFALVACAACGAPCLPGELDLECDGRRWPVCRICSQEPDPIIRRAIRRWEEPACQSEAGAVWCDAMARHCARECPGVGACDGLSEDPAQAGGQLSLELR